MPVSVSLLWRSWRSTLWTVKPGRPGGRSAEGARSARQSGSSIPRPLADGVGRRITGSSWSVLPLRLPFVYCTVIGAVARPAAGTPSAVREGFPLTRLLSLWAVVISTPTTEPYQCCGLVSVPVELENSLRSSVRSKASVIRLGLHQHPDPPIDRPHVSVSFALPKALASWGIPPPCGLRLAAYSSYLESRRGVTPFRVSIGRGFRLVLYAASLVSRGHHVPRDNGAEGDDSQFGPATQPLGRVCMTTLQTYIRLR
jgi:hypothetical protein